MNPTPVRFIVHYVDRDNHINEMGCFASKYFEVDQYETPENAHKEAMDFAMDVLKNRGGHVDKLSYVDTEGRWDVLGKPQLPPPCAERVTRIAISHEKIGQFHGEADAPLTIFPTSSQSLPHECVVAQAQVFLKALSELPERRVLSMEGFDPDANCWVALNEDFTLKPATRPRAGLR